jgi:hypothetical protein
MIMRSYFEGLKASAQINFKPTCFEGWFEYTDLRRPFWIFTFTFSRLALKLAMRVTSLRALLLVMVNTQFNSQHVWFMVSFATTNF